jgi:hypothetical protein
MSYAYKLNQDVRHQPQGPQGRAATDPPTIYTIVQLMPIEADGRLRYRIKRSLKISSESLRKISFRILSDLARLTTAGV